MTGVGHQHAIAARQRQIGCQRRALVAALFLDDLHQQDLTALDHVLDLVFAAQGQALGASFVRRLRAGSAAAIALTATSATPAAGAVAVVVLALGRFVTRDGAVLDGGYLIRFIVADILDTVFAGHFLGQRIAAVVVIIVTATAAPATIVMIVVAVIMIAMLVVILGAQACLFLGVLLLGREQRVAIFLGDLVIVGVNLVEGEEAVPVAAEIDERGLQRGFDPRHLRQVDIALYLLVFCRLEIKFFNPVALEHRHPRFFRVARID